MHPIITPEYLASQGLSPTFPERFWEKVFIMTEGRGCWLWVGSLRTGGYGQIGTCLNHLPMRAHVASWILNRGPIPKGLCVCHKCDIRPCVRPDHLFLGTRFENNQDMIQKGRFCRMPTRRGDEHPRHKLTVAQVLELRLKYHQLCHGAAECFGVNVETIRGIIHNRNWRHLQDRAVVKLQLFLRCEKDQSAYSAPSFDFYFHLELESNSARSNTH